MAEIYAFAIDAYFAHLPGVVGAVRDVAQAGGRRAESLLVAHRAEGHARITVSYGSVDSFVSLDDTRGQRAAAAIEFGRSGGPTGAMQGLFILRGAF
jgi:Family of unknown function (DUF5403)